MDKWADYLISEVSYDAQHLISVAIRHQDTVHGITKGKPVDRLTISSDIKNGISYITIYNGKISWKKGHKIQTFLVDGNPFLRIDGNKVKLDFLGDLPGVSNPELIESDLAPEPVTEETTTETTPPSSRGSLPKESTDDVFEEIEHATEIIPKLEDEEATPEQFAQLGELQKQIDELETKLSNKPIPKIQSEPEEEIPVERHSEFDDLQDQINELEDELFSKLHPSSDEPTPEQISRVNKLEKEIKKLESLDIEHEIIQTLQKQNKKLDDIKKNLDRHSNTTTDNSPEAYCVKCRTKRKIKNPEKTTMKNGRPAIKGICSTCNCKVFRIVKMKK